MGSSVQLAKKSRSQYVMLKEELPRVEDIQDKDQNEGISLMCLRN